MKYTTKTGSRELDEKIKNSQSWVKPEWRSRQQTSWTCVILASKQDKPENLN
jgi:hypothetical protein